jgi:hypothetical protein
LIKRKKKKKKTYLWPKQQLQSFGPTFHPVSLFGGCGGGGGEGMGMVVVGVHAVVVVVEWRGGREGGGVDNSGG